MTLAAVDQRTDCSLAVSTPPDFRIEWNAENQLTRVTKDAVEVATFAYDPKGRRIEKVAAGKTHDYAYHGFDMLEETIDDGVTTTTYTYVHGPGIDEPLAREDGSGTRVYYHADALGSIAKLTDSLGNVVHGHDYDAWGSIEGGGSVPGYAFTGREWDPETGLYYYRARYYDARDARFISADPMGYPAGLNLYLYVDNRPTLYVDPYGYDKVTDSPAVVACMCKLYTMAGNGESRGEATNTVVPTKLPEIPYICLPDYSWQPAADSGTVHIRGGEAAVVHTHSNDMAKWPSSGATCQDREHWDDLCIAKKYQIPVYSIHKEGIWRIDPEGNKEEQAGRDWKNKCGCQ